MYHDGGKVNLVVYGTGHEGVRGLELYGDG
jgi:hypothetical protein